MMDRRLHPLDLGLAAALTLAALAVYLATLTPSLSYLSPDGNELATIPYVLGLAHSPGYPLYTWLGKLFSMIPIGDVAHRINLMSAVLGALSVGGLYLILIALLPQRAAPPWARRSGSALAALLFAFAPTFWSQSVISEVYAPNIFMLALTLIGLLHWERTRRDRDFFLVSLVFGLSLGTHLSNLGFGLGLALFVLLTSPESLLRPRWWLAAAGGFALGAAQFAWLPLRVGTLNDRFMLERAPLTLSGIYNYTLGAFPNFKFAFPLVELPDRLVVYLDLLAQQFGALGILLGVAGLVSLLLRRTRHYFLLVAIYLVQVWFFIQYRAFDLEVFFLPAHFMWAIFIGFGIVEALAGLGYLISMIPRRALRRIGQAGLALGAVAPALILLVGTWPAADRSQDVAVNDFYANVWEIIPGESALLTQGGVFGYDAFYWRLVYNTRPDVLLPTLPTPDPEPSDLAGRDLYTTTGMAGAGRGGRGPGALPPDLLPDDLWAVPVLVGEQAESGARGPGRALTLTRLSAETPELVVEEAAPSIPLDADLGGVTLVGADLSDGPVESGGRLRLVLYWRVRQAGAQQVQVGLGGQQLESHELGFGNLARYQAEVGGVERGVVVEDYWLVIPSTTPAGVLPLQVRTAGTEEWIELGSVQVVNDEETMERWLQIAGRSG